MYDRTIWGWGMMEWCPIKTLKPWLGVGRGFLVSSVGSRWYERGPDEIFVLRAMVVVSKPHVNFLFLHNSFPASSTEA